MFHITYKTIYKNGRRLGLVHWPTFANPCSYKGMNPGMVAHACNSRYSGGGDWEDHSSLSALEKS
jgi:hypothetical protein